jgi:hypothetical protein
MCLFWTYWGSANNSLGISSFIDMRAFKNIAKMD